MTAYREIYVDFERNSTQKPEEINFTKNIEFQTRQSINTNAPANPRGFTLSLPNYLIFG